MMVLRKELVMALLSREDDIKKVIKQAKELEEYINGNNEPNKQKDILLEHSLGTCKSNESQLNLQLGGDE